MESALGILIFSMIVTIVILVLWKSIRNSIGIVHYQSRCRIGAEDGIVWRKGEVCVYTDFLALYGSDFYEIGRIMWGVGIGGFIQTKTIQFNEIKAAEIISTIHGHGVKITYKIFSSTESVIIVLRNPEKLKRAIDSRR